MASNIQYVVNNAKAFAGLCYKIGQGGGRGCAYSVFFQFRTTPTGRIDVYATHTVHDDDWLEFAYDKALGNDHFGLEYTYKRMIEDYKLTETELRSFQDVSDFMSFLKGGIPGFNSCKRSGHDFEITQELGSIQSYEKSQVFSKIKQAIASSYPTARAKEYGDTALEIHFY